MVSAILMVVIVAMLGFWQPWQGIDTQTISVMGEASIKATPNEFVFYPSYQESATTSTAAISAVSKVGNEVVAKLKELGVAEKAIKTSAGSNPDYSRDAVEMPGESGIADPSGYVATFSLIITLKDKDQAQKVLDYLVTTSPLYGVSPQSTFSSETRKDLETQARAKAIADAKTKAAQTADELDVKLGRVVSVSDPLWGGPIPIMGLENKGVSSDQAAPVTAPILLTGEETVTYTVTVVFRIR